MSEVRTIDANALKEKAETVTLWNGDVRRFVSYETIDNAPTVKFSLMPADETKEDAYKRGYKKGKAEGILKGKERPQGEWIRTGSLGNGNAQYECSECHYGDEHAESQEVPYCWHCGADMRGKTDA